jgi:hypothetical protein
MTLEQLLDRARIRETMTAYTIAGDGGRIDEMLATFCDDGILETPIWRAEGREAIREALMSGASGTPGRRRRVSRHHLTTSRILFDSDGTNATGLSYFHVDTDIGPDHGGTYKDRFVKQDGRWLIAERIVRIDWKSDASYQTNQTIWWQERDAR